VGLSYKAIDYYSDWMLRRRGLKKRVIRKADFEIEYWDSEIKNIPTLLMIPAFAADTKYSWMKQVGSVSRHFRLVIPNLLFFGRSTVHPKSHSLIDQARAIDVLIEHLNVPRFSLIAASYGALVAAEFLTHRKQQIDRMILTGVPLMTDGGAAHKKTLERFGIKKKSDLLAPTNAMELKRLFHLTYYRNPAIPDFVFRDIFKQLYEGKTEDKGKLIDACFNEIPFLPEKFSGLSFPVLLLWGSDDFLAPESTGKELQAIIGANAQLRFIPKTAHMPNFERPRPYNKLMREFLLKS